ncbi:hypothetical protein [Sphingobium sp. Z007]|uniref:hypothetical protein n=1 Tax=Sphingobium sp. Z007 TaxID=627495 RepID=UPI000B49CF39|nr:hypothetical protein [Sphingobium sp. Z007]
MSRSLSKNDVAIIELALQVLEEARDRASKEKVDTAPVRLALRCLRPHMPEQWPLHTFWEGTSSDNDIGRSASCTAGLNGIKVQLGKGGIVVN